MYRGPSGEYAPYLPPGPIPLKPEELDEVNRYFTDIASLSPQDIEALDEVTFHEFVSRYRIPQSFYSILARELEPVATDPAIFALIYDLPVGLLALGLGDAREGMSNYMIGFARTNIYGKPLLMVIHRWGQDRTR